MKKYFNPHLYLEINNSIIIYTWLKHSLDQIGFKVSYIPLMLPWVVKPVLRGHLWEKKQVVL